MTGLASREAGLAFDYGIVAALHVGKGFQRKLAGLGDAHLWIVANGHPPLAAIDVALGGEDFGADWCDADCEAGLAGIEDEAITSIGG
jgi:hypothetical protein